MIAYTKSGPNRIDALRRHVLIDQQFRDMVGYLSIDHKGERVATGTFFFASRFSNDGHRFYGVTARHLIQKRFLKYHLRSRSYETSVRWGDWIQHPTTDIAVCCLPELHLASVAIDRYQDRNVQCGHQVFMAGLFDPLQQHTDEVEPIVRFGHVALPSVNVKLASDPDDNKLTPTNVCLIETRSWGGESGSPVWIHSEYFRGPRLSGGVYDRLYATGPQKSEVSALEADPTILGLLHGHFEVERPQEALRQPNERIVDVNAGIAAVIPAKDIWEFIMNDKRLANDTQEHPRPENKTVPVPDSKIPQEPSFTKEDFESALKKVSRKLEPKQ